MWQNWGKYEGGWVWGKGGRGGRIWKIRTDSESLTPKTIKAKYLKTVGVQKKNVKNWGKYEGGWVWKKGWRGGRIWKILTESEFLTSKIFTIKIFKTVWVKIKMWKIWEKGGRWRTPHPQKSFGGYKIFRRDLVWVHGCMVFFS